MQLLGTAGAWTLFSNSSIRVEDRRAPALPCSLLLLRAPFYFSFFASIRVIRGQVSNLELKSGTKPGIPECPNLQHQPLPAAKLGQLSHSPPIFARYKNEKRYRNGKVLVNFCECSFTGAASGVDADRCTGLRSVAPNCTSILKNAWRSILACHRQPTRWITEFYEHPTRNNENKRDHTGKHA